jgi:hypothetical protein
LDPSHILRPPSCFPAGHIKLTINYQTWKSKFKTRDISPSINVVPTFRLFATERSLAISLHTRSLQLDYSKIALSHSSLRLGEICPLSNSKTDADSYQFHQSRVPVQVYILVAFFSPPLTGTPSLPWILDCAVVCL